MIKVIIDTNLWISFLIGKRLKTMEALFKMDNVEIFVCKELINEILDVAKRPKLQKYIKEEDIELLERLINTYCTKHTIDHQSELPIRDAKDLYLLSLCESIPADVILSGDDDLLSLGSNDRFKIMRFNDFYFSLIGN